MAIGIKVVKKKTCEATLGEMTDDEVASEFSTQMIKGAKGIKNYVKDKAQFQKELRALIQKHIKDGNR